ncbi:hypothetical protein B0H14DRAFT_204384 [Mycena olivaceomarginata]|nr:hypothetical protein B0H14DRAFT_204384 [Mycena olivaceomarginata]
MPPLTTAQPHMRTGFRRSLISPISDRCALVTSRKTNSDALNKVTQRGEEGRFVGSRDSKGYLIWFPDSKSIRSRRDVEFHGFPDFLPSPALTEILWDDIPADLEPRSETVLNASCWNNLPLSIIPPSSVTPPLSITSLPLRIMPPPRVTHAHVQPKIPMSTWRRRPSMTPPWQIAVPHASDAYLHVFLLITWGLG